MLGVTPYINFNSTCREAIEFYKSALQAEVVFMQTYGESPMAGMASADLIMHCTIKVGDSVVMMCDSPQPVPPGGNLSLTLGLDDPERAREIFDRLAEGGAVIMPLEKTFWAEAFGMVTDRFGVPWMVNCEAPK
ncbi:MAG: VOC family protein [Candidatus Solibacter sp.]